MSGLTWVQLIDWGSVPDWLAGCGAVVALWWARKAAKAAKAANERQDAQLQRQAEQFAKLQAAEESAQAELIAGWYELQRHEVQDRTILALAMRREWDSFVIQNGSTLPIYDVIAWADAADLMDREVDFAVLDMVPPGRNIYRMTLDSEFAEADVSMRVTILFRDSAYRPWYRQFNGQLERLTPEKWDFMAGEMRVRADQVDERREAAREARMLADRERIARQRVEEREQLED